MFTGFYDGSSNPNPGVLGLGFSVYKEREEIICGSAPGGKGTNNIAEYKALIWLMDVAHDAGIDEILIIGDSMLVTNQINGKYRVSSPELKELHNLVIEKKKLFKSIIFEWRSREQNSRADKLARRGVELEAAKVLYKDSKPKEQTIDEPSVVKQSLNIKVQTQGNGLYSFLSMGNPICTLNSYKMTCTCPDFLTKENCMHIEVFSLCTSRTNTPKAINT